LHVCLDLGNQSNQIGISDRHYRTQLVKTLSTFYLKQTFQKRSKYNEPVGKHFGECWKHWDKIQPEIQS
jgi:hypothetical protein